MSEEVALRFPSYTSCLTTLTVCLLVLYQLSTVPGGSSRASKTALLDKMPRLGRRLSFLSSYSPLELQNECPREWPLLFLFLKFYFGVIRTLTRSILVTNFKYVTLYGWVSSWGSLELTPLAWQKLHAHQLVALHFSVPPAPGNYQFALCFWVGRSRKCRILSFCDWLISLPTGSLGSPILWCMSEYPFWRRTSILSYVYITFGCFHH